MDIAITKRQWNISKIDLKTFSSQKVDEILRSFNLACSGHFYISDYYHKKIIVDISNSLFLCGHSKEVAEQEGFGFFNKILKPEEFAWVQKMNKSAYKTLFNVPIHQRTRCIVSYDLTFVMADGKEVVLHHKVTPFRLCKNGNMWLGLCYVTVSSGKDSNKQAIFYNSESGERYKLVDGEFALLDSGAITPEDVQILTLLAKGLSDKEIGSALGRMNSSTLKYKKRSLFEKLEVVNSAGAVHKAHLLGII